MRSLPSEISSQIVLLAVERVARLIDIAELHRLADLDGAGVRLLLAGDHAEQRGLAGAVRADDADDAAGRQLERQVVDQQIVAEAFAQLLEIDDVLAEPLGHRNDDLRNGVGLGVGVLEQFIVALVSRLRFGLTRLGRRLNPLGLALQRALARLVLAAFLLQPLLLLLEPGGVVALVGNAACRDRVRESSSSRCRGSSGHG